MVWLQPHPQRVQPVHVVLVRLEVPAVLAGLVEPLVAVARRLSRWRGPRP